jgi:hypothetical protein
VPYTSFVQNGSLLSFMGVFFMEAPGNSLKYIKTQPEPVPNNYGSLGTAVN